MIKKEHVTVGVIITATVLADLICLFLLKKTLPFVLGIDLIIGSSGCALIFLYSKMELFGKITYMVVISFFNIGIGTILILGTKNVYFIPVAIFTGAMFIAGNILFLINAILKNGKTGEQWNQKS